MAHDGYAERNDSNYNNYEIFVLSIFFKNHKCSLMIRVKIILTMIREDLVKYNILILATSKNFKGLLERNIILMCKICVSDKPLS